MRDNIGKSNTNPIGYNYERSEMRRTSVIAYARVSTKKQAEDGISFEDQTQQLQAFAHAHQLHIAHNFTDVGSGVGEEDGSKRESFNKACRLALKNDWPILVTVPSRFTRTLAVFDRFVKNGGRLISQQLGFDATEGAIRSFLSAEIVQYEQRKRTATVAQKRAHAEGRHSGNPDLAPARETSLKVRQAKALRGYEAFERQLKAARAAGASTPKTVAMAFNQIGFQTPQKGRWKPGNVRRNLEAIAALKAADELLSPAKAISAGNDNVARRAMADAASETDRAMLPNQTGFPLSPDELLEFGELLERSAVSAEMAARLMRQASKSALTMDERLLFLTWIARKLSA